MSTPVIVFDSSTVVDDVIRGHKITPHLKLIGEGCSFINSNYICLGVHGCGVVKDSFISITNDYQNVLNTLKESDSYINTVLETTRGSLCAYVYDKHKNKLFVSPDPLGGALVFYYRDGSKFYCSSDIRRLIAVLERYQVSLEPSIDFSIESAIFGNGGLNSSSYKNLYVLDPYQYIEFDNDKVYIKDYIFKEKYIYSSGSYYEKMELIRSDIISNIKAAYSSNDFSVKMTHLTGGFDSRLVFAALLHENLHGDYLYFCTGDAAFNSDKKIFEHLALEFDLNTTNHIGYDRRYREYSFKDKIIAPYQYSGGMFKFSPDDSCFSLEKTQVLSGGYGEILRSFYAARIPEEKSSDIDFFAEQAFGSIYFGSTSSILSKEFLNSLLEKLKLELNSYLNLSPSARLDALYLNVRNRYFVGNSAKLWSEIHSRFDPLYSLNSSSLALNLSYSERVGNVLGFDLLQSFSPKLAGLPFGDEKINQYYLKHRKQPIAFQFDRQKKSLKIDNRFQLNGVKTLKDKRYVITAEDKETAKRVGVNTKQAMLYRATRDELTEYLNDPRVSIYFDKKNLSRFFSERIKRKAQIKSASLLYENLAYAFR